MIAMLRYALLKSRRDGSVYAFVLLPTLFPLAALCGVTIAEGRWHYPLMMNARFTPIQNATLCAQISLTICVVFTVLPAFWTMRPEIATRSVASFFFAARPVTVAASMILFAFAIGLASWIGAITMIRLLTDAMPPNVAFMTLKAAMGCLAASAVGTVLVTISSQPAMIIGAYVASAAAIPWMESSKSALFALVMGAVSIVCAALAGFILERRCAS